jgi:hypothetical protein
MQRILNMVTRPFRTFLAWRTDRGSWLALSFRDQYRVMKYADFAAEGRMTYEQAEQQLLKRK